MCVFISNSNLQQLQATNMAFSDFITHNALPSSLSHFLVHSHMTSDQTY